MAATTVDPEEAPGASHANVPLARFPVLLYAATTFLSAFLVFQVQPLIGKYILPWFGGGSTVWTSTMLFFQVALLGGYAYAHFIASRLQPRQQGVLHLALLVIAIALLPIIPSDTWKPDEEGNPTWRILILLTVTVGAPYLLLSSTAPLVQQWFARDHPRTSPYRLYALSNAGSLLALLSYPVVFEQFLGLRAQAWLWSGGYVLFVLLCGTLAWGTIRSSRGGAELEVSAMAEEEATPAARVTPANVALWLVLPACASVMLLATTNQLTQDVASIPLLWVLPLSLYLLTFIICFGDERAYWPLRDVPLLAGALILGVYVLDEISLAILWQVMLYSAALFMACFALHGEMVRLKPAARHLTAFYLMVAVGGALGGIFVALIAPAIFDGYWEYHVALVGTALLVIVARGLDVWRRMRSEPSAVTRAQRQLALLAGAGALIGALILSIVLWRDVDDRRTDALARDRNFYGAVRVFEFNAANPDDAMNVMEHGRILHGFQFTAPEKRRWHSAYYGETSGVGIALLNHPGRAEGLSVGGVGLGAGMLASYAEPGDEWNFYEINPMVTELAERYFTYLEDARQRGADLHVLHGDGRLVLERQLERSGPLGFDVLVLDAFNSDSVPVHLLTREAFAMYWQHLKPDGILAINISNRHVDLSPVVRKLAEVNGKEAHWVPGPRDDARGVLDSVWVLVTSNRAFLDNPQVASAFAEWPADARDPLLWTDDFSNIYSLLRFY